MDESRMTMGDILAELKRDGSSAPSAPAAKAPVDTLREIEQSVREQILQELRDGSLFDVVANALSDNPSPYAGAERVCDAIYDLLKGGR